MTIETQMTISAVYPRVRVARPSDLGYVKSLQRKFSNQLGFVPAIALEWYIEHFRCLLGVENDEPAGYILGRPSMRYDRRICGATQVAVPLDLQRSTIGTELVEAYTFEASQRPIEMMQCWCAGDIAAVGFWLAIGWLPVMSRQPKSARGRSMILYRKALIGCAVDRLTIPPPVAGFRAKKTGDTQLLLL